MATPPVNQSLLVLLCETAKQLDFTTLYQQQNILKTLLCSLAVPLIVYMIITKKYLIYSEHHFIIHFKMLAILMFAFSNAVTHAFLITDRLFNADHPCEWVREMKSCVFYKAMSSAGSTSISTTLCFITVERGIFVLFNLSQTSKRIIVFTFSALQTAITSYVFVQIILIEYDDTALVLHCLEDTLRMVPFATIYSSFAIGCDTFTFFGSVAVKLYCERAVRKNRNHLGRAFAIRESSMTINAFFPLIVFHTVCLVSFNIAYLFLRPILPTMDKLSMKAAHAFSNVAPYYAFIAPVLLINGLRRLKAGRAQEFANSLHPRLHGRVVPDSTLYHVSLKKMWN